MKAFSYTLGVFLVMCFVMTPIYCQYAERNGPEWVQEVRRDGKPVSMSNQGATGRFMLASMAFIFGAIASFVLPNTKE